MTADTGLRAIRRTLGHRNYAIYVPGNGISLIGTWVQRIAIGWLTWTLTESGAWLGAVAFADLAPAVVIGPIGGVIADRFSRIKVIRIAQSLMMVQALALFALTASGLITIWAVLGLALANGVVIGFSQAAWRKVRSSSASDPRGGTTQSGMYWARPSAWGDWMRY